jgi:hypothetical protein
MSGCVSTYLKLEFGPSSTKNAASSRVDADSKKIGAWPNGGSNSIFAGVRYIKIENKTIKNIRKYSRFNLKDRWVFNQNRVSVTSNGTENDKVHVK